MLCTDIYASAMPRFYIIASGFVLDSGYVLGHQKNLMESCVHMLGIPVLLLTCCLNSCVQRPYVCGPSVARLREPGNARHTRLGRRSGRTQIGISLLFSSLVRTCTPGTRRNHTTLKRGGHLKKGAWSLSLARSFQDRSSDSVQPMSAQQDTKPSRRRDSASSIEGDAMRPASPL